MDILLVFAAIIIVVLGISGLGLAFLRAWPTSAMIVLLLAVYTNHFKFDVGPVTIRTEHVAVLLIAGLLIPYLLWKNVPPRVTVPGLYALAWWLALALSAFLHAPDFGDTLRHIIRLGLMVLTLLVTVNLVHSRAEWTTFVRLLYGIGVVEAAYGVLARAVYAWDFGTLHVLGHTLRSPLNLGVQITRTLPVPAPYGTLEEGNIFGSTMGALLVLSLTLWLHPRGGISRRWSSIGLLFSAAGWVLSLTRGAWLAVLVVLPLLWVLYPEEGRRRLAHLGLLFAVAPLVLVLLVGFLLFAPDSVPAVARLRTLLSLHGDPTFNLRMERWALAWKDIRMRPILGWGPGTFVQLHGIRYFAPAWLDSLTIKNLQEGGLFGVLALYGVWMTALGDGVWGALQEGLAERGMILGLTLGGMVLFLAYHVTDATWLALVWVWLGVLTARPEGLWVRYERT